MPVVINDFARKILLKVIEEAMSIYAREIVWNCGLDKLLLVISNDREGERVK